MTSYVRVAFFCNNANFPSPASSNFLSYIDKRGRSHERHENVNNHGQERMRAKRVHPPYKPYS